MNRLTALNRKTFILVLGVVALVLVACSSATPTPTPTSTPTLSPTATPIPTAVATPTPILASTVGNGLVGGDPEFNAGVMLWQGYWLSRDQFGPFVMASGMGIPFMPPMEMVQGAMQMVGQNTNDPIMLPQNMMPLQAIFASGSSSLLNDPRDFEPLDFEGFRLDASTFDETIGIRGQAETMLKETQWAHNFASAHFGQPDGDFGAQQRFIGMMVSMLAQMQGQYAMQNLMGEDGLYHDSDGNLDYTANWVMLHALSDLSLLTGPNGGRYSNPDSHPMFENAASQLTQALESRQPGSPQETAAAIRALTYRAWTSEDAGLGQAALAQARSLADKNLLTFSSDDVVDKAAAVVGLVAIAYSAQDGRYLEAAQAIISDMANDFDSAHGVFRSKDVYNVDDVAWIIGALNFMMQKGGDTASGPASQMLVAFYESTIGMSGIQLSAPPGKNGAMASPWEMDLPSVIYYHPVDTPPPPMSGKLPVPAEEITWDGSQWQVTSDRFVSGGAMHLANELNWLGPLLGSIPFPPRAP